MKIRKLIAILASLSMLATSVTALAADPAPAPEAPAEENVEVVEAEPQAVEDEVFDLAIAGEEPAAQVEPTETEGVYTLNYGTEIVNKTVYKVADGFYQDGDKYTSSSNFYITSYDGLLYFRKLINHEDNVSDTYVASFYPGVNGTSVYSSNLFSGKTAHLLADIDFDGTDWDKPIGYVVDGGPDKTHFFGNFDGHGHTVSNLSLSAFAGNKKGEYGFFGRLGAPKDQTIKNLTLNNVAIASGSYVGALVGNGQSNLVKYENCKVTGTLSLSGSFSGGIYGIANASVNNCTVDVDEGSSIYGISFAGGIAGSVRCGTENTISFTGNSVKNITVSSLQFAGGIAGGMAAGAKSGTVFSANSVADSEILTDSLAYAQSPGHIIGGRGSDTTEVSLSGNTVTDTTATHNGKSVSKQCGWAVASVGDAEYTDLKQALEAITADNNYLRLLSDVTVSGTWKSNYGSDGYGTGTIHAPATIDGQGYTLTFTGTIQDNNTNTVFHVIYPTTFKDLTVDISGTAGTNRRAISSGNNDLTIENCEFIGNGSGRAVIYGEGISSKNRGNVAISVTGSSFTNWSRGVVDNENGSDVKSVTVCGNTFTDCPKNSQSAYETIVVTDNVFNGASWLDVLSYTENRDPAITVTGNTLAPDGDGLNFVWNTSGQQNIQPDFCLLKSDNYIYTGAQASAYVTRNDVTTYYTLDGAVEAAQADDVVVLTKDVDSATVSKVGVKIDPDSHKMPMAADGCYWVDNNDGTFTLADAASTVQETTSTLTTTVTLNGLESTLKTTTDNDNNAVYDGGESADYKVVVDDPSAADQAAVNTIEKSSENAKTEVFDVKVVKTVGDTSETVEDYITDQVVTITVGSNIDWTKANPVIVKHIKNGALQDENITVTKVSEDTFKFTAPSFSTYYIEYTEADFAVTDITDAIGVTFVQTDAIGGMSDVYDIVLNAKDTKKINRFMSSEWTFAITPTEGIAYEITPGEHINLIDNGNNNYELNMNGNPYEDATGKTIKLGTVTITGNGEYKFTIAAGAVHTSKKADNIVDDYTTANTLLKLTDVNGTDTSYNNGDATTQAKGTLSTPKQTLNVNIAFPNKVDDNPYAYQDMTVTISGGDLAASKVIPLGSGATAENVEAADLTYAYTAATDTTPANYAIALANELSQYVAYTVTVEGEGYRTARYTVTMGSAPSTLNFWNNVKDAGNEEFMEVGKVASKKNLNFLAGDIVRDNKINIYDLSAVVSYFGTVNITTLTAAEQDTYVKYDLNRDGQIDSKDIAYVLVSWDK